MTVWNCPVCDTQNNEQYSKCEVCKTPRPTTKQTTSTKSPPQTQSSSAAPDTATRGRKTVPRSTVVPPLVPVKKISKPVTYRVNPHNTLNRLMRFFRFGLYMIFAVACASGVYFGGSFLLDTFRDIGHRVSSPSNTGAPSNNEPGVTIQATDVTLLDTSVCSMIIQVDVRDTVNGDVLTVYCANNVSYTLEPLAKGKYEVASNGRFVVYVTLDGDVYATRAGKRYLTQIGDFREFHMLQISGFADLEISISGSNPYYVNVYEKTMKERKKFLVPKEITN